MTQQPRIAKRPWAVTLLACGVFIMGGANAARVWVYLSEWSFWAGFDAPFAPSVRLSMSIVWALVLISMAIALWLRLDWARRAALVGVPLYIVVDMVWNIVFARGDYERGRTLFLIAQAAVGIGLTVWLLTRNRVKIYFVTKRPVEGLDVR